MPFVWSHIEGSRTVSKRWIVALAVMAVMPAAAKAQITTFIAPPNPVKDSIKAAAVAEQRATADSITHAQITDMKAWVDSAAGVAPIAARTDTKTWVDSAAATSLSTSADTSGRSVTSTSNGIIAPSTASPLPFILVLGTAAMVLGLVLLGGPALQQKRVDR
jgi:hypothetical protein